MVFLRRACTAVGLALVAGCAEGIPPTQPSAAGDAALLAKKEGVRPPVWVHRAPQTPPFKNEVVELVARAGEAAEVTLHFSDGSRFAELKLAPESMRGARLNGGPVAEDQAITIQIRRVDASRYLVDLQPSGLDFNPDAPAELTFFYHNALVSPNAGLGVWKQDRRGEAWEPTQHSDDRGARKLRARVDDFTVYAMAYL